MLIFLIIAALLLALPILGVWPKVRIGTQTHNNLWSITMLPADDPKWQHQSWAGVLAQEKIERWLQSLLAILLASPLAWLLRDLPGYGIIPVPLVVLAFRFARSLPGITRQIELIGHAAEVVVAEEREHRDGYARAEALAIFLYGDQHYGRAFAGMSAEAIEAAMNRRRPLARVLLFLFNPGKLRAR